MKNAEKKFRPVCSKRKRSGDPAWFLVESKLTNADASEELPFPVYENKNVRGNEKGPGRFPSRKIKRIEANDTSN